jgi:SulP family sulfate permease
VSVVVLDLSSVPVMDGTGLVSLESAVSRLHQLGMFVVLGGVQAQPLRVLARSGIREHRDQIAVHRTMQRALATAIQHSRTGAVAGQVS